MKFYLKKQIITKQTMMKSRLFLNFCIQLAQLLMNTSIINNNIKNESKKGKS